MNGLMVVLKNKNNIKAGNYVVVIKDSLENNFTAQIILSQPSEIIVEFISSPEVAYEKTEKQKPKLSVELHHIRIFGIPVTIHQIYNF